MADLSVAGEALPTQEPGLSLRMADSAPDEGGGGGRGATGVDRAEANVEDAASDAIQGTSEDEVCPTP